MATKTKTEDGIKPPTAKQIKEARERAAAASAEVRAARDNEARVKAEAEQRVSAAYRAENAAHQAVADLYVSAGDTIRCVAIPKQERWSRDSPPVIGANYKVERSVYREHGAPAIGVRLPDGSYSNMDPRHYRVVARKGAE